MRDTARLAEEKGVRLHTHLAETADENAFCEHKFGCRPLDYLEAVGWLGDRTWLAHGIHFTPEEIERLGRAGTGVAHCPGSNMVLASGLCPAVDLAAAGAPVGLGVDGSASEDASNLMQECAPGATGAAPALRRGPGRPCGRAALGRPPARRPAFGPRRRRADSHPAGRPTWPLFKLDEPRFSGAGESTGRPRAVRRPSRRPGHGRRRMAGDREGGSSRSRPGGPDGASLRGGAGRWRGAREET